MKTLSEKALVQRINRKLDGRELKKTRDVQAWLDLGDYYLLNNTGNVVEQANVDPIALGFQLGVLSRSEVVVPNRLTAA